MNGYKQLLSHMGDIREKSKGAYLKMNTKKIKTKVTGKTKEGIKTCIIYKK